MDAVSIDREQWTSFFRELQKESDRAAAILVAAYIDSLIGAKLRTLFDKGNSKIRQKLVEDANGPFSSFSAKSMLHIVSDGLNRMYSMTSA